MSTAPAHPDTLDVGELEPMGPELMVALQTIIKTTVYFAKDMKRDLPHWSLFLTGYAMALAEFLPEDEA